MKQKIDLDLVSQLEAQDKRHFIRDSEIEGFLIRVYPTGKIAFYLDYYSPCGENKGKRVQYKIAGSDLAKFQGKTAMPKKMQQVAVTAFRNDAKEARGLVDAKQDPSQVGRDTRARHEEEKAQRKLAQEEKILLVEAAKIEANNTIAKLLEKGDKNTGTIDGLYTKALKTIKNPAAERNMILQAWADLADIPLTRITRAQIESIALDKLRDPDSDDDDEEVEGLTASTVDRYCSTGRTFFNWAIKQGLCTNNPFDGIQKYAGTYDYNQDFRYLAPDEVKSLLNQVIKLTTPDKFGKTEIPAYMRPLTIMALHSGCRRGELFKLQWSDINGRTMTLQRGNTKSNKTRDIRLNQTALDALSAWKTRNGVIHAKGLVFPSSKPDKPLSDIKGHWKKLRIAADIADVKWHDLRHSFAANLALADVSIHKISQLLGHSDLKMTMRYAKLSPDHLDEIDVLDRVFA
jgi:integrase